MKFTLELSLPKIQHKENIHKIQTPFSVSLSSYEILLELINICLEARGKLIQMFT
jgi:hypothetical protein